MLIKGQNLTYRYPGEPVPLFDSLDFEVRGPGFISLFGLSGTGKSTLARLLCREIAPETGSISISAAPVTLYAWNTERFPGWCSVGQHIREVTPEHNLLSLDTMSEALNVAALLESRFRELSMGQKNRVNLLRYLLQDFDILIADEALANVDEPSRNRILGFIKKSFPDKTFIYISHNATEVARFSKDILILSVNRPHTNLKTISGLNMPDASEPNPEKLKGTVLKLLEAATADSIAIYTPAQPLNSKTDTPSGQVPQET